MKIETLSLEQRRGLLLERLAQYEAEYVNTELNAKIAASQGENSGQFDATLTALDQAHALTKAELEALEVSG